MPKWSFDNLLRMCLQFYKKEDGPTKREQFRYVLEYTEGRKMVEYLPQMSNTETNKADIKDPKTWCTRPHNYKEIYEPDKQSRLEENDGAKRFLLVDKETDE